MTANWQQAAEVAQQITQGWQQPADIEPLFDLSVSREEPV